MIDVTDNEKKVTSRNKKEKKIKNQKIRYPNVRSPSELSLSPLPLSPSPPHPSIPIIRYIHTYLICTVYESSSHSSSSASKVGCRSSAGGDFIAHTQIWKACTQAKVYGTFDTSYPLEAGVLVVWLFGRLVVLLLYASHASHIMYRRPSLPYLTLPYLSIPTYLTLGT